MAYLYFFGNNTLYSIDGFNITALVLAVIDLRVNKFIEITAKIKAKAMYKIPYSPVIDVTSAITSRTMITPMAISLFIIPFTHNAEVSGGALAESKHVRFVHMRT